MKPQICNRCTRPVEDIKYKNCMKCRAYTTKRKKECKLRQKDPNYKPTEKVTSDDEDVTSKGEPVSTYTRTYTSKEQQMIDDFDKKKRK